MAITQHLDFELTFLPQGNPGFIERPDSKHPFKLDTTQDPSQLGFGKPSASLVL